MALYFKRDQALDMEDSKAAMSTQMVMKTITIRSHERTFAIVMAVVLTAVYVINVMISGGETAILILFPLATVIICIISNYMLALGALIISLFVNYHAFGFSAGVWFSLPFGLSVILTKNDMKYKELVNPLTLSILIYGICIVPSFLNATQPIVSLLMLFNAVALLIVLYSIVASLHTYDDLRNAVVLYISMVLLNSLDVFRLSWVSDKRPFGFGGIMFVDYSALGICFAIIMSALSRGKSRVFLLLVSLVITVALLLTQTRNTWISSFITLVIFICYLVIHPELVGFKRKQLLVITLIGSILIAGTVLLVVQSNSQIEKRVTELTNRPGYGINEAGDVENSLGSRLLVWDTALRAFYAHPIIGTGVYSFPYSSHQYYKFSKALYKRFVETLTPHQSHLAVLSETGIIGAIGFIIFIVTTLKYSFQTIRQAKEERGKRYALAAAMCVVYCMVSMVFTDAWLWGQGIVLLGLVLGLMLANKNISTPLISENKSQRALL